MEQNLAVGVSMGVRRVTAKRRSWTMLEEKCPCKAFEEIIALGWKTENGFLNGFLLQLEQKMQAQIPGTDLKEKLMINSKYGTWKRHFKDVQDCLKNSGFNWCSGTKTLVVYPEV